MLAIVPVRDGVLPAGAAETIAECAGRVLLVGSGTDQAVEQLVGATHASTLEVNSVAPGSTAVALAEHIADEQQLVLPASPDGRDLAPRLAHLLHRQLFAGATEVRPNRVRLARRGGLVIEEVRPSAGFVATLLPGVRGVDLSSHDGPDPIGRIAVTPLSPRSSGQGEQATRGASTSAVAVPDAETIEVLPPDVSTMDLTESPRIFGGGAGLDSAARFEQLSAIAAQLGGSMGATRVITDRSWVGHERQIGTTGVVIDPRLYIAMGVSGAVQHTSGLGSPNHIISVNTDPHCPMMQMADLAITSDANAVLNELERLLAARSQNPSNEADHG